MSDNRIQNWCLALFRAGISTILAIGGIVGATAIALFMYEYERSQPAQFAVVPNSKSQSFEIEISNPVPLAKRVLEVRFEVDYFRPPEKLIGAIVTRRVVFEASDYDSNSRSFRKTLHDAEMPANGNLNLQFFIASPSRQEQWAVGQLQVYFGSRDSPESVTYADYPILCIQSANGG